MEDRNLEAISSMSPYLLLFSTYFLNIFSKELQYLKHLSLSTNRTIRQVDCLGDLPNLQRLDLQAFVEFNANNYISLLQRTVPPNVDGLLLYYY